MEGEREETGQSAVLRGVVVRELPAGFGGTCGFWYFPHLVLEDGSAFEKCFDS